MTDTRGRINPCVPPPRKRRPFRPSALALEAICPVSSLAVAMPPTAMPSTGQAGTTTLRVDQPTRFAPMPSSVAASPSKATRAMTRAGGGDFGSVVATTSTIAMPQATPAAMVDTSRYGNAITIASANVPPARPATGPADNPVARGGGGVGAPTPAAIQPPSAQPTSAPASPSVVVPAPMGAASTPSTGIRPMTAAATSPSTTSPSSNGTATASYPMMSGSTPSSNAASGGPPLVNLSGGGTGGSNSNGQNAFTVGSGNSSVPVGTIFTVNVTPPNGLLLSAVTITYPSAVFASAYLGNADSNAAPKPSAGPLPLITTPAVGNGSQASTTFVVDAIPGTFQIKVHAEYTNNNGSGDTTGTYTSVAPTILLQKLNQAGGTVLQNAPNAIVGVTANPQPGQNYIDGIDVQVTATAGKDTLNNNAPVGGFIMVTQTIFVQRGYTDTAGMSFKMVNPDPTVAAIDNGGSSSGLSNTLGMAIFDPNTGAESNSKFTAFNLTSNPPVTSLAFTTGDKPVQPNATDAQGLNPIPNLKTLRVGTAANPFETMTIYVMYLPPQGGTWIALAKEDWGWNGSATWDANNAILVQPIGDFKPAIPNTALSGAAAFPAWNTTTAAISAKGWQPQ